MASLNIVTLVGHLGQDAKLTYAQSGTAIANMRLATSDRYKDKDGQWQDRTEWHNVIAFGKSAEFCGNYTHKGSLLLVEGRLQTRKWQDKDGQDRYSTEVVANRVQCLDKREASQSEGQTRGQTRGQSQEPAQTPAGNVRDAFEIDSSVPF